MAQPTPSTIPPCTTNYNNNGADLEIQPEKPNYQQKEYASIYKDDDEGGQSSTTCAAKAGTLQVLVPPPPSDESGRERLKRHRVEMGGRVWIPDTWGQENSLKNWIDCTAFDASLLNTTILSARAALMQQPRSTNNLTLHTRSIENRC